MADLRYCGCGHAESGHNASGRCRRTSKRDGDCTCELFREVTPAAEPAEAKFWRRVEQQGDCWVYTGHLDNTGYGHFRHDGTKTRSHRYAYELMVGPIPEGLVLDHLCRNRACCNPAHLDPVTEQVNITRGTGPTAANAAKTHCRRGHAYDEANTYIDGAGYRYCRTCRANRPAVAAQINQERSVA